MVYRMPRAKTMAK